jgi:tetratricopeptide (TPR) repeat protein
MKSTDASNICRRTVCSLTFEALLCFGFGIALLSLASVSAAAPQKVAVGENPQVRIAEQQLTAGNFAQAKATLLNLLAVDPHSSARVYEMLAFAQLKLNSNDDALATCETGLIFYPASNSLASLYVSTLNQTLAPEKQIPRLQSTLKHAPHSPLLLKMLGENLLSKNQEDARALQLLASAAALSPLDPEAHFFYGESACFNQEDTLCIRELRRAHELAPNNQNANFQLYTMIAVSEDKLNLPSQAAEDFGRAMAANRSLPHPNAYAAMKYAAFLSAQSKPDEAMAIVTEILKWDPAYGPAHFERAKSLSDRNKREEAAAEAELALRDSRVTDKELRTYHAFLAKTYFAMGRQQDALAHQQWVESHPQKQ